MRARIPVVLALAALLAVACQDSPTDPVEQPVATAPEFNFMNGPAEAGVVFRHQGDFGWVDMRRPARSFGTTAAWWSRTCSRRRRRACRGSCSSALRRATCC